MAEALVEELLRTANNRVYRFGYEAVLQNLVQLETVFDHYTDIGQRIRSIPDFLVLNPAGKPLFVEVKFRSRPNWVYDDGIRELERIEVFWKAKIVMVTLEPPYFRVTNVPYFDKLGTPVFRDLVEDPDLGVSSSHLQEFERLIERYLANGRK